MTPRPDPTPYFRIECIETQSRADQAWAAWVEEYRAWLDAEHRLRLETIRPILNEIAARYRDDRMYLGENI